MSQQHYNLPPPGWYTDPYDNTQQRYWDGLVWTEYTHKSQGQYGFTPPTTMQTQEYPQYNTGFQNQMGYDPSYNPYNQSFLPPSELETTPAKTSFWVYGIVVALVLSMLLGFVGFALVATNASKGLPKAVGPVDNLPEHVIQEGETNAYGFLVNDKSNPTRPTIVVWEDFQCPHCKEFYDYYSPTLEAAAARGDINLIYRPLNFLDSLGKEKGYSLLASNAFGCAIEQDKGLAYQEVLYANHPSQAGAGWTDAQLLEFGKLAGVKDTEKYNNCVKTIQYEDWVLKSTSEALKSGISGTPSVSIDGQIASMEDLDSFLLENESYGPLDPLSPDSEFETASFNNIEMRK